MNKSYNNQEDIASAFCDFFNSFYTLSLPHQKILPFILLGMIDSESVVTSDIAKKLKGDFSLVHLESVQRRINRFLNNTRFDIQHFYNSFIAHIISNYKFKHNRVHISFDHMYSSDNFTILLFSLRIGKQGIPLWFKCFEGLRDPDAFSLDLIKEGISFVHHLFKNTQCELIFLADRWFDYSSIMKFIDNLGHTYCFRLKKITKALVPHPHHNHLVWKSLEDITFRKHHSKYLLNVPWTKDKFITNIVFGRTVVAGEDDPWIIATNGNPQDAISDYKKRWSIECLFKNQKSNGFYLESTKTKNLNAFSCLFGLMNVALTWLLIIGSDYVRNKHHYSLKIRDTKRINGVIKRVMSLFEIGLTIFNLVYNSMRKFKLKTNFILYDL